MLLLHLILLAVCAKMLRDRDPVFALSVAVTSEDSG